MSLYLVRHAQQVSTQEANPALSSLGLFQAKKLAERIAEYDISQIYSSGYARCIETASILANKLNIDFVESNLIEEIDRSIIGCPFENNSKPDLRTILSKCNFSFDWLKGFLKKQGNFLVVSHGNFISYVLGELISLPASERWKLMVWHTSVSKVEAFDNYFIPIYMNCVRHLAESEYSCDPEFKI